MRIIKILTDKDVKDFNRAAPKHEIVIAGFFMVKCPACEAFKPEWEKFVDSCKSEGDPNVLIAEIDSEDGVKEIADELTDRFGKPPEPVQNLLLQLKVKLLAHQAQIDSVNIEGKNIALRCRSLETEKVRIYLTTQKLKFTFLYGGFEFIDLGLFFKGVPPKFTS